MQKEESRIRWLWSGVFFLTAAIIVTADQLTKNWIRNYPGEFPVFEAGIFRIIEVRNTGSSFGLFQDHNFVLTIVAVVGIVLVLTGASFVTFRFKQLDTWFVKMSLGLLLGGTIGNLLDRLARGYVTDWIDVGPWPTFNVADSSMVCGVILLALFVLFSKRVKEAFGS